MHPQADVCLLADTPVYASDIADMPRRLPYDARRLMELVRRRASALHQAIVPQHIHSRFFNLICHRFEKEVSVQTLFLKCLFSAIVQLFPLDNALCDPVESADPRFTSIVPALCCGRTAAANARLHPKEHLIHILPGKFLLFGNHALKHPGKLFERICTTQQLASPKLARRQCDLIPVQPLHTDHTDDLPQKPEAADHQCNNDKIPHTASSHSLFHAALTDSV